MRKLRHSFGRIAAIMLAALAQGVWIGATFHSLKHSCCRCVNHHHGEEDCDAHHDDDNSPRLIGESHACQLCEVASIPFDPPVFLHPLATTIEGVSFALPFPLEALTVWSIDLPFGHAPPSHPM